MAEKVSGFLHNCVRTSCRKISPLRREYMLSPLNLLKHSPKISDLTKTDLSVLGFLTLMENYCESIDVTPFKSVLDPLTR